MVVIQSRSQNIFNRFYVGFCKGFPFAVPILIGSIYSGEYISDIFYYLIVFVAILAIITLWLIIFNSGQGKVIEFGLEVTDNEICFIKYGSRQTIMKNDFVELSIKDTLPKMIVIKAKNSVNIEFSYYTFASEQRNKIFNCLSSTQHL